METTGNGIEFDMNITGPQGARYTLYPEKGKHTEADVKKARGWLYHNQDVVSIQIRWKKLGDTLDPPQKIPDYVIISELKIEIGKLRSEIDEIEDVSVQKSMELLLEEKKKILKEQLYTNIKKENSKLKKDIKFLRDEISTLIVKVRALELKS